MNGTEIPPFVPAAPPFSEQHHSLSQFQPVGLCPTSMAVRSRSPYSHIYYFSRQGSALPPSRDEGPRRGLRLSRVPLSQISTDGACTVHGRTKSLFALPYLQFLPAGRLALSPLRNPAGIAQLLAWSSGKALDAHPLPESSVPCLTAWGVCYNFAAARQRPAGRTGKFPVRPAGRLMGG